jgi:hypothetical protein
VPTSSGDVELVSHSGLQGDQHLLGRALAMVTKPIHIHITYSFPTTHFPGVPVQLVNDFQRTLDERLSSFKPFHKIKRGWVW